MATNAGIIGFLLIVTRVSVLVVDCADLAAVLQVTSSCVWLYFVKEDTFLSVVVKQFLT